ncbi:unnamed protein product, partial [Symbiodinium natans]
GTSDTFVAEVMPGASDSMRRFRSLTMPGQCLEATAGQKGLQGVTCAQEAEA